MRNNSKNKKTRMLTARLTMDEFNHLDDLARLRGMKRGAVVREAIRFLISSGLSFPTRDENRSNYEH